jgi:hemerythrin superfamily protein
MCEYCGCQEIATIAGLYREHDDATAHMARIRSALAADHLDGVAWDCQQILAILGPHTVVEEEGLFPEMTDEFPDHIEVLRADHRQIEKVLGEASNGLPDDPTWPERLLDALRLLDEHILKEQDGVFPAALIAPEPDQWERIESVRAQNAAHTGTSHTETSHAGTGHKHTEHAGTEHTHTASPDQGDRG